MNKWTNYVIIAMYSLSRNGAECVNNCVIYFICGCKKKNNKKNEKNFYLKLFSVWYHHTHSSHSNSNRSPVEFVIWISYLLSNAEAVHVCECAGCSTILDFINVPTFHVFNFHHCIFEWAIHPLSLLHCPLVFILIWLPEFSISTYSIHIRIRFYVSQTHFICIINKL